MMSKSFTRHMVKPDITMKTARNPNHSVGDTRLCMNVQCDEIRFILGSARYLSLLLLPRHDERRPRHRAGDIGVAFDGREAGFF